MAPSSAARQQTGWQARLALHFEANANRTVLARRQHYGPLAVQRPFYPEPDGGCHVYILHPPGGIVGGDELSIEVTVGDRAHSVITTPGASKIYRNTGEFARINQALRVERGGLLEWLPQETIVFDASNSVTTTDVHLQEGAEFCGWDIVCLGRPAAGERFMRGAYNQQFRVWREGQPLCIEANRFEGGAESLTSAWGLAGFTTIGTMLLATDNVDAVQAVRDAVANEHDKARFGVTQTRGVLIARYLGHSAEQAKQLFTDAWQQLRPLVFQREAVRPRVWDT